MMEFSLEKSLEILEKTPRTIETLVADLSNDWIRNNEGENTWTVVDIVAHLIHADQTNWLVRLDAMLHAPDKEFPAFDRFGHLERTGKLSSEELLNEFKVCRELNIAKLKSFPLEPTDLLKKGIHSALGPVSISELLSTWVVHDLNHLSQIARVMAYQYKEAVGPFIEFLTILK
jgi:predicted metalloendopeptidase